MYCSSNYSIIAGCVETFCATDVWELTLHLWDTRTNRLFQLVNSVLKNLQQQRLYRLEKEITYFQSFNDAILGVRLVKIST